MKNTNWPLIIFLVADGLFLITGIASLAVALVFEGQDPQQRQAKTIAARVLLPIPPLSLGLANAVPVFVAFLVSVPGVILYNRPVILRAFTYMVILAGLASMTIGLDIWIQTLQTRLNLRTAWASLEPQKQSQLQQLFNCCGYLNPANPPFVQDAVCTDPKKAESLGGCVTPFSSFSNSFLDVAFTAMFAAVAIDAIVFFSAAVLAKDRREKLRWRLIDRKYGQGAL